MSWQKLASAEVFAHLGESIADGLQCARRRGAALDSLYRIEDPALAERLLADPRPKVFVMAHLGSWELAAAVVARRFGERGAVAARVQRLADVLKAADIQAEPVADARVPLWEKFIYLAPFAAFTGAARLPIGPLWSDPAIRSQFMAAAAEVEAVARAEGVAVRESASLREYVTQYVDMLPPTTRSSLLIDLQQGKRIEVESLPGSVVRRGQAAGVPTPVMAGLYSVLKPWAGGRQQYPVSSQ